MFHILYLINNFSSFFKIYNALFYCNHLLGFFGESILQKVLVIINIFNTGFSVTGLSRRSDIAKSLKFINLSNTDFYVAKNLRRTDITKLKKFFNISSTCFSVIGISMRSNILKFLNSLLYSIQASQLLELLSEATLHFVKIH